uniref:Uncharacterized protein n=1 Tax=Haematobia irritans TaxID=7368 RepID=A0A1L8EAS2_HAEIR
MLTAELLTNVLEYSIRLIPKHSSCRTFNKRFSGTIWNRLMMFVISVVSNFAIVDGIEESHSNSCKLEEWSDSGTFRLHIFVIPTPPSTAHSASNCAGRLVTTSEPGTQFIQFHLTERNISFAIEACWVIRTMYFWVVFCWIITESHFNFLKIEKNILFKT